MSEINVGIIGYGIVGSGSAKALIQNKETIFKKTGININVRGVADTAILNKNDETLSLIPVKTTNADDLINDPQIHIIVELIGGYTVAKEFIMKAINAGKHVVTANKALLALHGKEIFNAALQKGVEVGFEASVGGGIPIINVLKEDLAANNIQEINAIINGTANYILTRMVHDGEQYQDVLKDAQRLGYAEANPSFDVDGIDAAHKLTLISSIAFGTWVDFKKVYTEGITQISTVDIDFAKELDCTIKLLAIAKRDAEGVEVRVHPTFIPRNYQLAAVNDSFNAVQLKGDIVGTTLHYGRGAGSLPTGSAVAGDIIRIARHVLSGSVNSIPALGFTGQIEERLPIKDINNISSAFYLRFTAEDTPGVLSAIAGILAKNGISIRSALQRPQGDEDNAYVPLVFLTHKTNGCNIDAAVKEIDKLPSIHEKTVIIRVEGIV